jgi:putative ABC transport system permease protein
MPIREIILQTLAALRESKLRSFLTMFGIVWGITSVILLVGLGIGFNRDQHERMKGLGTDIAIMFGGKTDLPWEGYAPARDVRLNIDDAIAIRDGAPLVKTISPEIRSTVQQVSRYNASSRAVRGVWPQYQTFRSLTVSEGRLMTDEDEQDGSRVVLLGFDSARQLFPGKPAIGETVMIAGYPYIAIGVMEKKKQNGSYGSGPDNSQLFVPFSAMERDFPPTGKNFTEGTVNNIVIQPVSAKLHKEAVHQVRVILGARHHSNPVDPDAIWTWDTLEGAQFLDHIFGAMTMFFAIVALLTLALGGIGVMNIMLVAVTERTREIGVRKALGATAKDIRRQFLAESAVITLLAGGIGLLIGMGVCLLLRLVPLPDFVPHPVISTVAVVASMVTLAAITICAGMYPALRAATMTPIECLRTD